MLLGVCLGHSLQNAAIAYDPNLLVTNICLLVRHIQKLQVSFPPLSGLARHVLDYSSALLSCPRTTFEFGMTTLHIVLNFAALSKSEKYVFERTKR